MNILLNIEELFPYMSKGNIRLPFEIVLIICVIIFANSERQQAPALGAQTHAHTLPTSLPPGPCQADPANEKPLEERSSGASLGTVWSDPPIVNTPCS